MEHSIEKNKEVFEREMTEVLLKLKGRFSVVSRNDTLLAEAAAIEIPEVTSVTLPEINCDFQAITLPDTAVVTSAQRISNSTLEKMTVPAVPDRAVTLPQTTADIPVEKPVLGNAGVGEITVNSTLAEVECEFTEINLPETEITVSSRQINTITFEKMATHTVPDRAVTLPQTTADIPVEKPVLGNTGAGEITVNSTLAEVECEFTEINLPDAEITVSSRRINTITFEKMATHTVPDRAVTLPQMAADIPVEKPVLENTGVGEITVNSTLADVECEFTEINLPDTETGSNKICITVPETVRPQMAIPDISVTGNIVLGSREVVKPQLSLPDTETGIIFSKIEPVQTEKNRVEVTDAAFSPMKYTIPDNLITINKPQLTLDRSFDWSAAEELRGIYGK